MAGDLDWTYDDMWQARQEQEIGDGFGNYWPAQCPQCGAPMDVLRAGTAVCAQCNYMAHGQGGIKEL